MTNEGKEPTFEIKNDENTALVGLSALSSAANISGQTKVNQPLDIVLVLDTSGSMNLGLTEIYSDELNTSQTYYINYGTNSSLAVRWDRWSQRWESDYGRGYTPKSSAGDNRGTQFYTNTKLQGLKEAVDTFIGTTADNSTADIQHRIALVTFSGNNANNRSRGLINVDASSSQSLQNIVNSLSASGATPADAGLEMAENIMTREARNDAQKIVIFFTDGLPTTSSDWSDSVAGGAINAAYGLKSNDTTVFSIGVFEDADPGDMNNRFNRYMNAVSSNYPEARCMDYWGREDDDYTNLQLGARDAAGQYYYAADSADSLNAVFEAIQDSFGTGATSPIETTETIGGENVGYLTFTDTLGDYTEIKNFKAIVFAGQEFTEVSHEESSDGSTIYTFAGKVSGNEVYPGDHDLADIKITVSHGSTLEEGDTVKVEIPSTLLPLRLYTARSETVDGETTVTTDMTPAYPIRVFYTVGLKSEVMDGSNVDASKLSAEYITNHTDEDGNVYFYSNDYDADAAQGIGTTTASFTPATTNSFYYFTQDTPIYSSENTNDPVRSYQPNQTYYYQRTYFANEEMQTEWVSFQSKAGQTGGLDAYVQYDSESGTYYIRSGAPRLTRATEYQAKKETNTTETAFQSISPAWEGSGNVLVRLGNNGKIAYPVSGNLEISKTVDWGNTGAEHNDKEFTYTVDFNGTETLSGNFEYTKYNAEQQPVSEDGTVLEEGQTTGTITDGGTLTLANGEHVEIEGLPAGTEFKVTETQEAGYTASVKVGDAETQQSNEATGTITSNATEEVSYTNRYSVTETSLAAGSLHGEKMLTGRDWKQNESFTFTLEPVTVGAPLPENAQNNVASVTLTNNDGNNYAENARVPFQFGEIKYEQVGEYIYLIRETKGNESGLAYSNAVYRVTVKVTDDGSGNLTAGIDSMYRTFKDNGDSTGASEGEWPSIDDRNALFTNNFGGTDVDYVNITGRKEFTNYTTGKNLDVNDFYFILTAETEGAPMPDETRTGNLGTGAIEFSDIEYGIDDIGKTYVYQVKEEIPVEAQDNGDGTATWNGMTYDTSVKRISVTVIEDGDDGSVIATVTPSDGFVFRNSYQAAAVTTDGAEDGLQITKRVNGHAGEEGQFTFTMTPNDTDTTTAIKNGWITGGTLAADDVSTPETDESVTTLTKTSPAIVKDGEGTVLFDDLTFSRPGTYTFNITEKQDPLNDAWDYDNHAYQITFTVEDESGQLTVEHSTNATEGNDTSVFINAYEASMDYDDEAGGIYFSKTLNGYTLTAQQFNFTVTGDTDADNAKLEEAVQNLSNQYGGAAGQAVRWLALGNLTFDQDDAGVTYNYTVSEIVPNPVSAGYSYDETPVDIAIEVIDDNDGSMHTVTTITKGGESPVVYNSETYDPQNAETYPTVPFINSYDADDTDPVSVNFEKQLSGRDWKNSDTFNFTLTPDEDSSSGVTDEELRNALSGETTATVSGTGEKTFTFGEFTFTKAGTYVYKVTEDQPVEGTDTEGITYSTDTAVVTFTVRDNGTGKLSVSTSISGVGINRVTGAGIFTNTYTYDPVELEQGTDSALGVQKTVTGAPNEEDFSFTATFNEEASADVAGQDGIAGKAENIAGLNEGTLTALIEQDFAAGDNKQTDFGTVVFREPGVYVFDVKEDNTTNASGWNYDADTKQIIVTIVDNTEGELVVASIEGNDPLFINSYVPTGVIVGDDEAQLQVTKQVTGAPALSEFAFTLQLTSDNAANVEGLGEGNALTESTTGLTGTENSETVNFGELTFTAAGDYVFTVTEDTEKPAGADGWTYDNNPRTITVHVTDDNYDGQLDATVENNNPVITNSYVPTGVIVGDDETQLQVTKQVTGAPALSEFAFTLQLTSDNAANVEGLGEGNAITESTTGLTGKEDSETVDFGELTFTAVGDYVFTVKEDTEKPADADGWTYDNSSYTITVHVTDENYDGQLDATVEGNNPTVTNQYKANEVVIGGDSGNAGIAVQKTLFGRNWQEGDSFSFTLAAADGTPMPVEGEEIVTISNEDTEKTAEFGAITYTETGTYHYTVTEAGGNIGGVTYDKHIANVTVNVTDENYDGQLDAEVTYDNNTEGVYEDDADVTTIAAFTNTYEPGGTVQPGTGDAEAQLTKVLEGRDWLEGDQFSFIITADEDTPAETLPAETTVTVGKPESGNSNTFDFGPFTFNAEGVYHYTVREEGAGTTVNGITYSTNEAHITINVTDNLHGGFAASVTITNEKFINTYSAGLDYGAEGGLNLVKRLDGHDIAAGQFQFQVTPVSGDGYVSAEDAAKKAGIEESGLTVSTDAASMVDGVAVDSIALFNQMKFDQTDNGKTYAYQISEVQETKAGYQYDKTTYTVTISVSDDNNGVLTVTTVVSNGTDSTAYVYTSEDGQNTPAQVVFNNAYDGAGSLGGEGAVSIQADKELLNGQLSGNDFTFIVTDKNEAEVTRGTNDASGKITFNEVAYTTDKLIADLASGAASYDADSSTYTYQYTVTEDTSNFQDMGVIANVAHFNITVTVKDNGDGTLTTAVDYGQYGDGLTFQNTYGTGADIAVNIGGTKELAHADGLTPPDITGAYQFTISGQDENGNAAPLPENTTASNDANGNVSFGAIQYTMENVFGTTAGETASDDAAAGEDGIDTQIAQRTKTYTYTVTESGNVAGVTNDQEASKTFTIVVTDNGDGTLSVTDGAGNTVVPGAQFTFVNTYSVTPSTSTPTGDGGITITKNLEGRALNEGEFTFEMTGLAGTISEGMAVTGTNDAAGNVALGGLEFSRPGTYEFRISEVIPETPAGGVTYDGMTYQATAEVTDNHDGTLAVAWTVKAAADGEALEQVTFTNTYKAAPAGVQFGALKRLDGDARDLKAGEFTFQVKDESGKVVATAKNKADGSVRFDSITFDKAGTYTYTISEVKGSDETITYDETVYTAIVNVTDDLNGQLYASVTAEDGSALKMTFTNKYTKPAVPVEPDEGPTAVRTGDTAPILPIILVMAAALAAIIAAAAVILRRNRRQ